jgi:type I restriction enzyme R subunit
MSRTGPEYSDAQRPAIALLREVLGYAYADGQAAAFAAERESETEVLLLSRLARKLSEINPGLTEAGVKQAMAALQQPLAAGLLDANEACHRLLSRWVAVDETRGGKQASPSVHYIDFDEPANNEFLVVEEFTVRGPRTTRRLDLVLFVNGIPLVAIECKAPGDQHGIEHGVGDLLLYQDAENGVARLFHTVQLCLALKRNDARYGTVETPLSWYTEWKSVYPRSRFDLERELGRALTKQDVTLAGLLAKENLLDFVRNFVVFDRDGGKVVKKVARYPQFEAVNEAIRRVADPASSLHYRERSGVIWHTQGSGKSLTMLWLCLKLRRQKALGNPTLLVVTDRKELDAQITKKFRFCGFENPVRAARVSHLRKLLSGPGGQTVLTTVQKFLGKGQAVGKRLTSQHPVLSEADNLFVLVDEAHRSQYLWFAAHMRQALPNACFLAFTGTPLAKTRDRFGSYIHKYTMPQSVADEATVRILYESRLPELAIWGKRLDPLFEVTFAHLSEAQREKLKRHEITERRIAEAATDRTRMIAHDIASHYRTHFEPDGFKAQVAACSQRTAARYYEELDKCFPGRVALLISDPAKKDSDLWALKARFAEEREIVRQYRDEGVDTVAILVVADKYLTGFDAPIERVLYLDKPLREHSLLQAIARVNRPLPERDKRWGLVVDYWGVAGFLDRALAAFADDLAVDDVMHRRDDEAAYQTLRQRCADALALFPAGLERSLIEPWVLLLEPEDKRAIFLARYREFYRALEQLLPDPRALAFLADFAWLRRLRQEVAAHFQEEDTQLPDCHQRVRALIDQHVKGQEVTVLLPPVSIMSEEFAAEIAKLHSPRAKASRMEHAIRRTVTVRLDEDPVFYESLRERLERIIQERREQRIDDTEELRLLASLHEQMRQGRDEQAAAHGIPAAAYPIYGILAKNLEIADGAPEYGGRAPALATGILEALRHDAVLDWQDKEDVKREMRRNVKRLLRLSGIEGDQVETITTQIMDLARVRLR